MSGHCEKPSEIRLDSASPAPLAEPLAVRTFHRHTSECERASVQFYNQTH